MFFKKKTGLSLDALFLKKKKFLSAIVYDITKDIDEIDDILHEVFLSLHKNWETIEKLTPEKQNTYFCVATKNQAINAYRKNKEVLVHESPLDKNADLKDDLILEQLVISKEMVEETKAIIKTLEDSQRMVLELSVFCHLKDEEIADALNISTNLVRVRKHRARQELKKRLTEVKDNDS